MPKPVLYERIIRSSGFRSIRERRKDRENIYFNYYPLVNMFFFVMTHFACTYLRPYEGTRTIHQKEIAVHTSRTYALHAKSGQ